MDIVNNHELDSYTFNSWPTHLTKYAYIGRKKNSFEHWGNPFSHTEQRVNECVRTRNRDTACEAFDIWLKYGASDTMLFHECVSRIMDMDPTIDREALVQVLDSQESRLEWMLMHAHRLKDHDLVCWCAPQRCHGESLRQYVKTID